MVPAYGRNPLDPKVAQRATILGRPAIVVFGGIYVFPRYLGRLWPGIWADFRLSPLECRKKEEERGGWVGERSSSGSRVSLVLPGSGAGSA